MNLAPLLTQLYGDQGADEPNARTRLVNDTVETLSHDHGVIGCSLLVRALASRRSPPLRGPLTRFAVRIRMISITGRTTLRGDST
jgi:hypothetical protein